MGFSEKLKDVLEYGPQAKKDAEQNVREVNKTLDSLARYEMLVALLQHQNSGIGDKPIEHDTAVAACRLAFCYLYERIYPTKAEPMKTYKFLGGPKDGEEIKTTNAPHPRTLMFCTDNAYVEYTMYTETTEGEHSTITYTVTKTDSRNR